MASAQTGVHILTLDRVKVSETLTRGERFIKWCDQVNRLFPSDPLMNQKQTFISVLFLFQDPNSASPVTLKVDPNGFFLHWQDQTKKVLELLRDR